MTTKSRNVTVAEGAFFALEGFFLLVSVGLIVMAIAFGWATTLMLGFLNLILWGMNLFMTIARRRRRRLAHEARMAQMRAIRNLSHTGDWE